MLLDRFVSFNIFALLYFVTCSWLIDIKFLKKRIREIEEEFPNIKFIFTYSNVEAEEYTYNLLKAYYDKQTNIIE